MAPFEIRPYEESDEPEVVALWNRVFPDDPPRNAPERVIRQKLEVQRELFLVGLEDGRLVATVLGGYDGHRGWIYHLAVDPDHQRRGYGRRLLEAAEARLRALGCPKINLQVRADNESVVAFYRRAGYAIEERVSLGKVVE